MRTGPILLLLGALSIVAGPATLAAQLPTAVPNDNRVAAGVRRDGVLRVELQAVHAMWHPDGDSLPGVAVDAFAEAGQPPRVPAPLLSPSGWSDGVISPCATASTPGARAATGKPPLTVANAGG